MSLGIWIQPTSRAATVVRTALRIIENIEIESSPYTERLLSLRTHTTTSSTVVGGVASACCSVAALSNSYVSFLRDLCSSVSCGCLHHTRGEGCKNSDRVWVGGMSASFHLRGFAVLVPRRVPQRGVLLVALHAEAMVIQVSGIQDARKRMNHEAHQSSTARCVPM